MNNYEDRTMSHKRVRMDGEGGPGVVQGNGLPLNYMDNGHQVGYGAPPGAYAGGGGYYGGGGGAGATGGGDWGEYGARGLAYAPPAHQPYQQPPPPNPAAAAAAAFLQHQQHLQMQYEQQRHHLQQQAQHHTQPHHKWPQGIMQPLQTPAEQKMKSEVKTEPSVAAEPLNIPQPLPLTTMSLANAPTMHPVDPSGVVDSQAGEDPPKIKIKTDIFKDETSTNPLPSTVGASATTTTSSTSSGSRPNPPAEQEVSRENKPVDSGDSKTQLTGKPDKDTAESASKKPPTGATEQPTSQSVTIKADISSLNTVIDPTSGENVPLDSNPQKTEPAESQPIPNVEMPSPSSSSSSEDESKIPNDVYFGTPDYRTGSSVTPNSGSGTATTTTPAITSTPSSEGKKRGRPKGSTNKPKQSELAGSESKVNISGIGRGQVGRPRGGTQYIGMRPFKRDFSGIRFRRRWSDECLDSAHIPNEVYFGDVPVSMEILYNYYDANADKEKMQSHQGSKSASSGTPSTGGAASNQGNVTLVYSSSDSSSDDSSDSDSSGDEDDANKGQQGANNRGRGRPRGSKTINRRVEGPRTSVSGGDKGPGVTEMKRFLKIAGIQYDYPKLVDGCNSNKERVAKLMGLLREKGLQGEPTVETCKALYSGPPRGRRGPPAGVKRGPRKSKSVASDSDDSEPEEKPKPKVKPVKPSKVAKIEKPKIEKKKPEGEGSRRLTRGATSGKPRQKIIISSDEEDSPLSKLKIKSKK